MIKNIALAFMAIAATIPTQAAVVDNRIFDPTNMTDTQVATVEITVMKHFYFSFINGWYSKAKSGVLHLDD